MSKIDRTTPRDVGAAASMAEVRAALAMRAESAAGVDSDVAILHNELLPKLEQVLGVDPARSTAPSAPGDEPSAARRIQLLSRVRTHLEQIAADDPTLRPLLELVTRHLRLVTELTVRAGRNN